MERARSQDRSVGTLNNSGRTNTDFIFNPYKSDSRAELLVNTGGAAVVDLLGMDPESAMITG